MFRRITASLSIVSLAIVSFAPLATFAAPTQGHRVNARKIAPEFASTVSSGATVRVLLQTKGAPSAAHDNALLNARGTKRATYSSLNTIVADVPLNELQNLGQRTDIEYIAPDRPVKSQMNVTSQTTGADQVRLGTGPFTAGFNGNNITIAILDSGISADHPDFVRPNGSRVIASVDFSGSSRSGDADGHGTGVAGVAAGSGSASTGYSANYAGIAPEANLIDVRVLDENGVGRASNVLAALNWVIQNRQRYNIRV